MPISLLFSILSWQSPADQKISRVISDISWEQRCCDIKNFLIRILGIFSFYCAPRLREVWINLCVCNFWAALSSNSLLRHTSPVGPWVCWDIDSLSNQSVAHLGFNRKEIKKRRIGWKFQSHWTKAKFNFLIFVSSICSLFLTSWPAKVLRVFKIQAWWATGGRTLWNLEAEFLFPMDNGWKLCFHQVAKEFMRLSEFA